MACTKCVTALYCTDDIIFGEKRRPEKQVTGREVPFILNDLVSKFLELGSLQVSLSVLVIRMS